MRKKIAIIALALAVIMAVGLFSTLAYFTDSKSLTNTFTVGNLNITLTEPAYTAQNQKLLPGTEIGKDPTVTVEEGSEPAYVFMRLKPEGNIMNFLDAISINTNWKAVTGHPDIFVYQTGAAPTIVDAGTAAVGLPNLFASIKVKTGLDNTSFSSFAPATDKLTIEAFAHQAYIDGTASYATAEAAAITHWTP